MLNEWPWIVTSSSTEVSAGDPEYRHVMKKITELVGSPKNYGLSPEEQEEEDRKKEEERKRKQAERAAEMKRRKKAALAEMALQYEQWVSSDWGTKKANLSVKMLTSAILLLSRRIWLKWSARRKSWWKLVLFLWGATWWRSWSPLSLRPCWTAPRSNQRTPSTIWCFHAEEHTSDFTEMTLN